VTHMNHASAVQVARPDPDRASGPLILIADDNRDSADSLALLLRLEGCRVFVAHDGYDAWLLYAHHRPNIVLLDIGLPTLDGYEVARRIRAFEGEVRPLLIAITGWGQAKDLIASQEAGFDHHLTKPADPEAIVTLIGIPARV
jgi:CheY-like chemotaxis protein